jgi:hypothetical protein
MRLVSMSRKYRPTVADKRYAQTIATLSSISDEAASLCSELDEAVRDRLGRDWTRGWNDGFQYGREVFSGAASHQRGELPATSLPAPLLAELVTYFERVEEAAGEVQDLRGEILRRLSEALGLGQGEPATVLAFRRRES